MLDEYQGIKELYEVVLKAKTPMTFGERTLEEGEPVLYFEKINMALLTEQNKIVMARGGWENRPHVIWEDRSEVRFSLTEGVLSSISLSMLLSARMLTPQPNESLLIPMRDGPFTLDSSEDDSIILQHKPFLGRKVFIYEYERNVAQKKVYGHLDPISDQIIHINDSTTDKQYIVDYYYEYTDEALIYTIERERFHGLFTLEGKFYSKDENEGHNYINLLYMPKVRVISNIDLRLGERADPTTAVFNVIGMPETVDNSENLILRMTRLNIYDE